MPKPQIPEVQGDIQERTITVFVRLVEATSPAARLGKYIRDRYYSGNADHPLFNAPKSITLRNGNPGNWKPIRFSDGTEGIAYTKHDMRSDYIETAFAVYSKGTCKLVISPLTVTTGNSSMDYDTSAKRTLSVLNRMAVFRDKGKFRDYCKAIDYETRFTMR